MNRDEIIRMAREAGLLDHGILRGATDDAARVERFAALVAAAEREACAKVCQEYDANNPYIGQAKACAANIRAREEK